LQERTPQCLDAADVRLRRTGADRKTDYRARHIGRAIANDRAECDQIVKFRPRQNRNITAPFWIARFKAALSWNSISAVTSCVRANSGTSSRSSGRMAPPLRILIFVAIGEFYFGFHGVKAEIDASARLYQCAGAMPCWSRRPPDRLRALRRNCQSDRPCRISDSGTAKAGVITVG
jgi:hypothetical protein